MSDFDDDDEVAEGPLFLLWSTQEFGGHAIYAQWNGFTFDLYGDEGKELWFGEAERLDDVDEWAFELLAVYERLPVAASDYRTPRGGWGRPGRSGTEP